MDSNISLTTSTKENITKKYSSKTKLDVTSVNDIRKGIKTMLETKINKGVFLDILDKDSLKDRANTLKESINSYKKINESKNIDEAVIIQAEFRDLLINLTIEFDFGVPSTMMSTYYIGKAHGIEHDINIIDNIEDKGNIIDLDKLFNNNNRVSNFNTDVMSESSNDGISDVLIYRFDKSYRYIFINGWICSLISLWVQFIDYHITNSNPIANMSIHLTFQKQLNILIDYILYNKMR